MLPKAHLTLHSRISGSRWVMTPSWLSGSLRPFWYSSTVYSCYLFLISSASLRSLPFLSFIVSIFVWNFPLLFPIFSKRFLVFPILLFSGFFALITDKTFLSLLAILWNSAFRWVHLSVSPLPLTNFLSYFFVLLRKPFCLYIFGGLSWSPPPVQCHKPAGHSVYQI